MNSSFSEKLSYHLGSRQFALAMGIAVAVHVAALITYWMTPKEPVIDIPVRVLNIRLGSGDELEVASMSQAMDTVPDNNAQVENSLGDLFASPATSDRAVSSSRGLNALEQAIARKASKLVQDAASGRFSTVPKSKEATLAHQYVRERDPNTVLPAQAGNALGNSAAATADVLSHYEQAISSWIQRFKLYPEQAKKSRITGDAVLRVRIDRRGNVRYNALESSTGYPELDRAALEMVRRANPVPPVPADYPASEVIEFLIPVSFRLQ